MSEQQNGNGIEKFNEAVKELDAAVEAVDQAHSTLKALGLHQYLTAGWGANRTTFESLAGRMETMLAQLKALECDECGHPVAKCVEENCGMWAGA